MDCAGLPGRFTCPIRAWSCVSVAAHYAHTRPAVPLSHCFCALLHSASIVPPVLRHKHIPALYFKPAHTVFVYAQRPRRSLSCTYSAIRPARPLRNTNCCVSAGCTYSEPHRLTTQRCLQRELHGSSFCSMQCSAELSSPPVLTLEITTKSRFPACSSYQLCSLCWSQPFCRGDSPHQPLTHSLTHSVTVPPLSSFLPSVVSVHHCHLLVPSALICYCPDDRSGSVHFSL